MLKLLDMDIVESKDALVHSLTFEPLKKIYVTIK